MKSCALLAVAACGAAVTQPTARPATRPAPPVAASPPAPPQRAPATDAPQAVRDAVYQLATASITLDEPFAGDANADAPHAPEGECGMPDATRYQEAWCTLRGDHANLAAALAELYDKSPRADIAKDLGAILGSELPAHDAIEWIARHVHAPDATLLDALAGSYVARTQWRDADLALAATVAPDTCARAVVRARVDGVLGRSAGYGEWYATHGGCDALADLACLDALAPVTPHALDACTPLFVRHPDDVDLRTAIARAMLAAATTWQDALAPIDVLTGAGGRFPPALDHGDAADLARAALAQALASADCDARAADVIHARAGDLARRVGGPVDEVVAPCRR